jgi:formylglycine-generating enzyme required for sulfatase activity
LCSRTVLAGGEPTDVASLKDCPDCPELVVIPAGSFIMGSPDSEEGREAGELQHRVTISKAFAMGKYLVTKGEFRQFTRESGYAPEWKCFSIDEQDNMVESTQFTWETPGFDQTDREPVTCVDALDAEAYALWLSAKTGKPYRLPTEAEYEYAARAGTATSRYWGDSQDDGCAYANGHGFESEEAFFGKMTQCDDGYIYTSPVGSYRPNAFGLYDMLGNVWVWLADCWHETYDDGPDSESAVSFPGCTERVMRGGSYISHFTSLRAAARHQAETEARFHNYGIRIARDLTLEETGESSHSLIP